MELETTPGNPEVPTGITEDQAASELLKKWGASEEEASPEAEPTEEAEAEVADEATPEAEDESEPQDDNEEEGETEESGDIEIDIAGEKFKLPKGVAEHAKRIEAKAKEVEAGATRKFQEAADLRKAAEAGIEQAKKLSEIAHKQSDLIADHKMVTRRLAQLEQIDVAVLGQTDPAKLTMINAEYNQLMAAKNRIEQTYQTTTQEFVQADQTALKERFEKLETFAKANVKGWSPEYSEKLAKFAEGKGLSREWLKANLNEGLITLIDAAHYAETVRTAQPVEKRVKDASKTLKPNGAGITKTATAKKADDAMQRLKRTGGVEDAAMALLTRSKLKR